jgi:nitrile hydratase
MAAQVPAFLAKGAPADRNVNVTPRFEMGQSVRARNIHPLGHTRLPRYARGKLGTIDRDHGVQVFPDTSVAGLGEKPQHVYSVRFLARELWGDQASGRDAVYIDMWDDYLEPA